MCAGEGEPGQCGVLLHPVGHGVQPGPERGVGPGGSRDLAIHAVQQQRELQQQRTDEQRGITTDREGGGTADANDRGYRSDCVGANAMTYRPRREAPRNSAQHESGVEAVVWAPGGLLQSYCGDRGYATWRGPDEDRKQEVEEVQAVPGCAKVGRGLPYCACDDREHGAVEVNRAEETCVSIGNRMAGRARREHR
jgi:hypothetical protein